MRALTDRNIDDPLAVRLSPRAPAFTMPVRKPAARSGSDAGADAPAAQTPVPTMLARHCAAAIQARRERLAQRRGVAAIIIANLDLLILFGLLTNDLRIRIPPGNIIASFTLLELFIWAYCAPYVLTCLGLAARQVPRQAQNFMISLGLYGAWLGLISLLGLLLRGSSDPLQNIKNVLPGLIMAPFLLFRIRDMRSVVLLSDAYVLYGVLAAGLAVMQWTFGGPYFRELIDGIEYKADFLGEYVANPAVGFSRHPNEFAMSILPALALAAVKFWVDFRLSLRINFVAFSISALLLGAIILAQAKGAFAFFIAALLFVVSPLRLTRSFVIKLSWVGSLIFGIVLFGNYTAETNTYSGSATIAVRYLLWQTAFRGMAADTYIGAFGDGGGYIAKWSDTFAGWEFLDAHNTWIDQIALYGLPALAFYLAIWWSFFGALGMPRRPRSNFAAILQDGYCASLLAIMGDSFFEPLSNDVAGVAQPLLIMSLSLLTARLGHLSHIAPDRGAGCNSANLRGARKANLQPVGMGSSPVVLLSNDSPISDPASLTRDRAVAS